MRGAKQDLRPVRRESVEDDLPEPRVENLCAESIPQNSANIVPEFPLDRFGFRRRQRFRIRLNVCPPLGRPDVHVRPTLPVVVSVQSFGMPLGKLVPIEDPVDIHFVVAFADPRFECVAEPSDVEVGARPLDHAVVDRSVRIVSGEILQRFYRRMVSSWIAGGAGLAPLPLYSWF